MLKLDNNLLEEIGLGGLPEDQKRAMLQHIYETLELRVGTNLANQMTDQQLEEFEKFIDEGGDANQAQALQWLETNLPNYKQVVNEVFEQLKGEIKQMAPQIMAASTPPAAQAPQAAPGAQPSTPDMAQPAPQQPAPVDYQPPVAAQGPASGQQPQYQAPPQYGQPFQPAPTQPAQPYPPYSPQQQPPAGPGPQPAAQPYADPNRPAPGPYPPQPTA